jgi:hypothetical protein
MKYIKYFEGISLLRVNRNLECEELKDFCESNLIYLIDEGFTVEVIDNTDSSFKKEFAGVTIRLSKYDRTTNSLLGTYKYNKDFNWNDIKDYYIPFLIRLSKEYKTFDKCLINLDYGGAQLINYDDLMKGKFDLDKELKSISIKVGEKL